MSLTQQISEMMNGAKGELQNFLGSQFTRVTARLDTIGYHSSLVAKGDCQYIITTGGKADANGVCELRFESRRGIPWRVQRIVTNVPTGTLSTGVLYVRSANPPNARHIIDDADFYATSVGEGGIYVEGGDPVVIRIAGIPPNTDGIVGVLQVAQGKLGEKVD